MFHVDVCMPDPRADQESSFSMAILLQQPSRTESDEAAESRAGFNLFRDLRWHAEAVFALTRSSAGFLILPVLILPIVAMLAADFFMTTSFLCDVPELAHMGLAFPEHALNFRPWIHHYDVRLDVTFKQAFIVASAQDSDTNALSIRGIASANASSISGIIPLIGSPLPHVADIEKDGKLVAMHVGCGFSLL